MCYQRDRPLNLIQSRRYRPEEVESMVQAVFAQNQPVYLEYMELAVQVVRADVRMAATLASLYHNACVSTAAEPDGWEEETESMQRVAELHMQLPSSDESEEGEGSM